jgi:hypothetical protein
MLAAAAVAAAAESFPSPNFIELILKCSMQHILYTSFLSRPIKNNISNNMRYRL